MTPPTPLATMRRAAPVNFSAPLVLDPPRHSGLAPIALISGRHLIGSASGCAIRLQADGIQDRHALILVGENRTIVKALDARTWVNDSPVSEMALRKGDRLSIGPLTFRVRIATADEVAAFATVTTPEPPPATTETPHLAPTIPTVEPEQRSTVDLTSTSNVASIPLPEPVGPTSLTPDEPVTLSPPAEPLIDVQPVVVSSAQEADEQTQPALASPSTLFATAESLAKTPLPIDTLIGETETPSEKLEVEHSDQSAPIAPPEPPRRSPAEVLNSRLDEIEKCLVDLHQSSEFAPPSTMSNTVAADREALVRTAQLQAQRDELESRTAELTIQTAQLQARLNEVADREAQVERQHESLMREAEHLADVAETARRNLAEEHRRLSAQWKEWDEQYHRMTNDLASQCDVIERQRVELRAEADRVSLSRTELQTLRSNCDAERRIIASERAKLASDATELQDRQSQFDAESQRQTRVRQELELKLDADRRALSRDRDLLDTERKEFDSDRSALADERAEHERQCEQDAATRDLLQSDLDAQRNQLVSERNELEELRARLDEQSSQIAARETISDQPAPWSFEALQIPEVERPVASSVLEEPSWSSWTTIPEEPATTPNFPTPSHDRHPSEPSVHFDTMSAAAGFTDDLLTDQRDSLDSLAQHVAGGISVSQQAAATSVTREFRDTRISTGVQADWAVTGISPVGPVASMIADIPGPHSATGNDIEETLHAVNRQFGVPTEVESPPATEAEPAHLPAWWRDDAPKPAPQVEPASEADRPWIVEGLATETAREPEVVDESPIGDLRSQLAKLFDLPTSPTTESVAATSDENLAADPVPECSPTEVQVAPAPTPALTAESEDREVSEAGEADSVEAFMARLLARNRADADLRSAGSVPSAVSTSAPVQPVEQAPAVTEVPERRPGDVTHLLSEPKHKQDKQAVRENLQSFRQVAHLSARSALARHSLRQLRNATIAKGLLLGASLVAAFGYLAEPLYGRPMEVWKASGCLLAALLSAMEFNRRWRQLRKPITGNSTTESKPSESAPVEDLEQAEAPPVAD